MSRLNTVIQENRELKSKIENIIETVKENEEIHSGYRVVEYSFLLSESLSEVDKKPISYIKDIFGIDKVVLMVNDEALSFSEGKLGYDNIVFEPYKTFRYFFLEKRPYAFSGRKMNLIKEFDHFGKDGSCIIVPLLEGEQIIGSLNLYSKDEEKFKDVEGTEFIKRLSVIITVALRKLVSVQKVREQSRIDTMTGLLNRHALYEKLEEMIDNNQKFTLILSSITGLKRFNLEFGYKKGDELLKNFGGVVERAVKAEMFGRFSGDEFFMIVNSNEQSDIENVTKNIMMKADEVFKYFGCEDFCGVKGGVVFFEGKHKVSCDALIKMADRKLVEALEEDRNTFRGL